MVLTRGRDEFKRIWGNRKLTDNWRISRKIKLIEIEETNTKNVEDSIAVSSKENNSNENNIDTKPTLTLIPGLALLLIRATQRMP